MVPVAFPHDFDATNRNIEVRKEAMAHLSDGGVVILFPAGRCSTKRSLLGPPIEHDWNPFTAKMILRSKAKVVPVYFPGANGAIFQTSQLFSATMRQGLMMHEIWRKIGTTIKPTIGKPMDRAHVNPWQMKPTRFMEILRSRTLALRDDHDLEGLV